MLKLVSIPLWFDSYEFVNPFIDKLEELSQFHYGSIHTRKTPLVHYLQGYLNSIIVRFIQNEVSKIIALHENLNSIMVRFIQRHRKANQESRSDLNSIMVRFILMSNVITHPHIRPSQFHYGSIHTET